MIQSAAILSATARLRTILRALEDLSAMQSRPFLPHPQKNAQLMEQAAMFWLAAQLARAAADAARDAEHLGVDELAP